MKLTRRIVSAALAALVLAGPAAAQSWPDKPITVIVPFGAGGGTDAVARVLAEALERELGQKVLVDNRGGANGSIGASAVAKSAPDGYTFLMTTSTTHAANPSLLKELSYDPIKDFTPVARIGYFPFMLAVNPDVPANTVAEFVELAKAHPGEYSYAFWQGTTIVAGATLSRLAGIELLDVPFNGTTAALTDVLGGRVSAIFIDVPSGLAHVKSGGLRALGVTTKERSSLMPDLPSIDEAGVPGFNVSSWMAVYGPAGLPDEITQKMNAAVVAALTSDDVKKRLADLGFDVSPTSPDELAAYNLSEIDNWAEMVKAAGIEPK